MTLPAKRYPNFLEVIRKEQERVTKELKAVLAKREVYELISAFLNAQELPNDARINFYDDSIGVMMEALPTQSITRDFNPLAKALTRLFQKRHWRTDDECSVSHGGFNPRLYYRWSLQTNPTCTIFLSVEAKKLIDAEWRKENSPYSGTNTKYILVPHAAIKPI